MILKSLSGFITLKNLRWKTKTIKQFFENISENEKNLSYFSETILETGIICAY